MQFHKSVVFFFQTKDKEMHCCTRQQSKYQRVLHKNIVVTESQETLREGTPEQTKGLSVKLK